MVTLDGWSANFVGPYGNTWVETSALNGLARDALTVETAYADSVHLGAAFRTFWQGRHGLCPDDVSAASLGDILRHHKKQSHLITDDPLVARHPLASRMSSVTLIDLPPSERPAGTAMQTQFGQFMANAAEALQSADSDCIWIHARAFAGSWDAPYDLRLALTDAEEDPNPSRSVETPDDSGLASDDPDAAWNLARSYAAQMMAVDRCLEVLFEIIDDHSDWRDALLIATAPRSFPLGEHGRIGLQPVGSLRSSDPKLDVTHRRILPQLQGESLHVPLFVRSPDVRNVLVRSHAIVQPACVLGTLADWFQCNHIPQLSGPGTGATSLLSLFDRSSRFDSQWTRAASIADGERSLRTPGWFLRAPVVSDKPGDVTPRLFVKPDDRWEANEVADRCPDVVESMQSVLNEFVEAAEAATLDQLPDLPDLLFASTI